jgi:hypothetical protein
MIYKMVLDNNYAEVIKELKSEMEEYWYVVEGCMYNNDGYLARHRLLAEPTPPFVNGNPDYEDYVYEEEMQDYLDEYDERLCEDNYLEEVEDLEIYAYFKNWMEGDRPCYYANEKYMEYLRKNRGF